MMTIARTQRKSLSSLLIVTMLLSFWPLFSPQPVRAGFVDTAKKVAKTVVVQGGALTAGFFGGVVGMALGTGTIVGGPIGMVAGGVGGYLVGKKVMNWVTSSTANVAMVLGAVGGGLLCAGMGFPVLAAGVLGGALLGRGLVALYKKITGKSSVTVSAPSSSAEMATQETNAQAFLDYLQNKRAAAAAPASSGASTGGAVSSSGPSASAQDAYNKYMAAYDAYMEATKKGDATAAQNAYREYKTYLDLYNASVKGAR